MLEWKGYLAESIEKDKNSLHLLDVELRIPWYDGRVITFGYSDFNNATIP